MLVSPTKIRQRAAILGPYWRAVGGCIVALAGYVAIIKAFHTETAQRATAPPWYAWLRVPPVGLPGQAVFLILPIVVFAGWLAFAWRISRSGVSRAVTLLGGFAGVLLMNVSVSMMDGNPDAIWKPFDRPGAEYFYDVPAIKSVGSFLRSYVDHPLSFSVHTRTHPPGAVLLLYFVARLLGPSVVAAAWAAVVITATAVVPFYLLARRLAGERIANLALALYVVTPSLVLFGATSMDGVFLVPLLWSIYFVQRTINERGWLLAVAAGISVTISLMFSYVTVCVGAMMLIYAALKLAANPRSFAHVAGSLAICAIMIMALLGTLFRFTGFNYLTCLQTSRLYDHFSMRTFSLSFGRYLDISVSNLLAFLIGVGVASLVLWGRQSLDSIRLRSDLDRFNIALMASVLIFSFAGLFTHETERIWLFFMPPALIAAATWIACRADEEQKQLLDWSLCVAFAQTWVFQLVLFTIW